MEAPSSSDQYRSSSSSAGSPSAAAAAGRRYYFPRPGRPISFEDSPDWGDDITAAGPHTLTSASLASSSYPSPSPSLPEPPAPAFRERKVAGAALVWKELTVSVRDGGRRYCSGRVVKGSSGYALPGTLTVVMGPARSGKSTLLRAIAGRLRGAERMYGEVFINGVKSPLPYGSYGYVDRDDVLIESLTVREMLYYSALLQLPDVFSSKKAAVDDAIAAMSLGDYADKLIGGHCFAKRLPTGERRRHFSNAGFPCPIMQSPTDHFLRAINTDFDRIIAMCKNLQDDQGDFSSVSMDTAVAIRTLEATYKSSAESASVESMIAKLTEKVRVSAIFVFVSFVILLSVCGVPAHINEIKIYSHEDANQHSGTSVFLLGHFLSSIPFLFLLSISSSLVFYFLIGLRNEFNFLMYFIITIFMCLLANEALMMIVAYIWLETYKCTLTLICLYGLVENEYVGTSFAVGTTRTIPGVQAVRGSYDISSSTGAKWVNLLVLLLMAVGYHVVLYVLLHLDVRRHVRFGRVSWPSIHTGAAPK
ncbi:hypothetical protein ACQ4PT_030088 [Festuca glaucescens]